MGIQATKIVHAFVSLVAYVVVLAATYFVHVRYFRVDVVFYGAIFDAVLAGMFTLTLLYVLRALRLFTAFERVQLVSIWLLFGYIFAISIPTVIDRSLSFYLLEKLHHHDEPVHVDRFHEMVSQEYIREHRVADVRLTEQEASGTIEIIGNCVQLTPRGERLARFSRYFRAQLLPRRRLLGDEYSDALADSYLHSQREAIPGCNPVPPPNEPDSP